MNKTRRTKYIYIVDRNPLVSNYYYGLLRLLLQLVVPND